MSFYFQMIESPVGRLALVVDEQRLHAVIFEKHWPQFRKRYSDLQLMETPALKETKRQLADYFRGERRSFDLPFHLTGTAFQKKVWSALARIPFGQTRTYKQQAAALQSPNAMRAVGRTNGLNPLCIVLPCHRVIGSNGALTGYAGGLEAKRFLLELEKRQPRE